MYRYNLKYLTVVQLHVVRLKDKKYEKTSTGCRKGAGSKLLRLRATGETKNCGSWYNIPKQGKDVTNNHKIYPMATKYTKKT
jgi:hypothetical protein